MLTLGTVQTYWIVCSFFCIVAGVTGLAASAFATPVYEARARMLVSAVRASPETGATSYQETSAAQQLALTLVPFVSSEIVTERVVQSLNLDILPTDLSSNVRASVEPETAVISLFADDSSPTRARDIANALGFEFTDFVAGLQANTPPSAVRPSVALVEPAAVPVSPISPNVARNVGLGALAGLGLGFLVSNLVVRSNNGVRDRRTVENLIGAPVLGAIPGFSRVSSKSDTGTSDVALEACKGVRTNLAYVLKGYSSPVISVVSSEASEGKTSFTVAVANAFAAVGYRVVVIDGDLRSGTLSRRFNLDDQPGVADVVLGGLAVCNSSSRLSDCNFSIVPRGQSVHPSETLASSRLRRMFGDLGQEFDFIFVDTPPVRMFTDAALIASQADAAVMIVPYALARADSISSAVDSLRFVGARIIGGIVTFSPIPRALTREFPSTVQRDGPRLT